MHWADVLADELLKEKKEHVLATGITPSGPIHIGNMREVLTTDAVYRCLLKKGGKADFIYIADDFDHLRKVYPYLPKSYEQYVGTPISDIPCPCGDHKSYADHYLSFFLNSLEEVGINPKIYRASEMYKNGDYSEAIQIALENTEKIKTIIENISKRTLPKGWIPFNIRCEKCGKITSAKPTLYEFPFIEYKCSCGYEGTVDIRKGGVGKLPWRVDWPARWKMLGVTFEPCGKDLATVGGARDTGAKIVEEIYDYPPPTSLVYEFILLKGKGAMHSSKGTALSADEMLHMTPPEVLRFLIMKNQPNKHINFDPGLGLLNLIDEYDQHERAYFGAEEETKGTKDLKKTYELSQPYKVPKKLPYQIPYRHLVTLVQISNKWAEIKQTIHRTGQVLTTIDNEDEERLKNRAKHASYWLNSFAPSMVKFELKQSLPKIILTTEQKQFLLHLKKIFDSVEWKAENIHDAVYDVAEKKGVKATFAFKTIYQIFLGQDRGPRLGYFLSSLDKTFVLKRFNEATTA
ncbi:lysyl-tRNA synthetase, class I [Thermoplasmatales archaeon SCGC AB-539-N05]|nr:lysyl-tRNA synthetase, class I [Thermoplasmatales archaeon SCGC AB-539-N05]